MKVLEIRVFDTVIACETLQQTLEYIEQIIRDWFISDSEIPLSIVLTKLDDRGPPVLEINVNDQIKAEGGLV